MGSSEKLSKKLSKKTSKKLGREPTKEEVTETVAADLENVAVKKEKKSKKKESKKEAKVEKKVSKKSKKDGKKSKKESKKSAKKDRKSKKRSASDENTADPAEEKETKVAKVEEEKVEAEPEAEPEKKEEAATQDGVDYSITKAPNPENSPRVFLGNCSYDIDDEAVVEFFRDCGKVDDVFWLTDKDTGKFYGTGFVTFCDADSAARAVSKNNQPICGRNTRIELTTPRKVADKSKGPGVGKSCHPTSEKPDGSCTIFIANLSFSIEEDNVHEFFKDVGTINSIRWCEDRESGQFKGCGFVEFTDTETVDKAVKLAGETLMGRQVRMDYAS